MVDGRSKGNRFENDVCYALSVWLCPKPSAGWESVPVWDLPFRRRTTSRESVEGHWKGKGDILWKPTIKCPFAVECKKIEGWSLDGMFSPKWPVWSWWMQAVRQADTAKQHPLLIFARNRFDALVMIRLETLTCLHPSPLFNPGEPVLQVPNLPALSARPGVAVLPLRSLLAVPRAVVLGLPQPS